jgi:hypothetical protein
MRFLVVTSVKEPHIVVVEKEADTLESLVAAISKTHRSKMEYKVFRALRIIGLK